MVFRFPVVMLLHCREPEFFFFFKFLTVSSSEGIFLLGNVKEILFFFPNRIWKLRNSERGIGHADGNQNTCIWRTPSTCYNKGLPNNLKIRPGSPPSYCSLGLLQALPQQGLAPTKPDVEELISMCVLCMQIDAHKYREICRSEFILLPLGRSTSGCPAVRSVTLLRVAPLLIGNMKQK